MAHDGPGTQGPSEPGRAWTAPTLETLTVGLSQGLPPGLKFPNGTETFITIPDISSFPAGPS